MTRLRIVGVRKLSSSFPTYGAISSFWVSRAHSLRANGGYSRDMANLAHTSLQARLDEALRELFSLSEAIDRKLVSLIAVGPQTTREAGAIKLFGRAGRVFSHKMRVVKEAAGSGSPSPESNRLLTTVRRVVELEKLMLRVLENALEQIGAASKKSPSTRA